MKHPIDVHVGKRLRHRRWMAGMTQQQLGDAVGIKFQQIQKYETGMNRISASRLWELSGALGVPVSFFFDGMDEALNAEGAPVEASRAAEAAQGAPSADLFADKEALDLVRAYYAIPENQRRRIFDLTRALGVAA
ncbi:helix-turn-helix transcriptional regulator [Neomegalonema sp.]|uniref:helix-turn-helix domain-containing protein n=1 Tax=Neomegalonema sp. TaxID=2039713 RepID=UPI00260272CB|nr:helix-turn-helix transcriptional regulator [Neomegalonema sp.]MDD2870179.1 helix-turn-helix transcriptional regulator [Neomegalonema sp.]